MLVQWDNTYNEAWLFETARTSIRDSPLVIFPYCPSREAVDVLLRRFGHRRRAKWDRTDWGAQARVRKA